MSGTDHSNISTTAFFSFNSHELSPKCHVKPNISDHLPKINVKRNSLSDSNINIKAALFRHGKRLNWSEGRHDMIARLLTSQSNTSSFNSRNGSFRGSQESPKSHFSQSQYTKFAQSLSGMSSSKTSLDYQTNRYDNKKCDDIVNKTIVFEQIESVDELAHDVNVVVKDSHKLPIIAQTNLYHRFKSLFVSKNIRVVHRSKYDLATPNQYIWTLVQVSRGLRVKTI